MPGLAKKASFAPEPVVNGRRSSKPDLTENPHVSAFLSPKSRIFTGGHGRVGYSPGPATTASTFQSYAANSNNGVVAAHESRDRVGASSAPQPFSIAGKQLTPDEVAQKIASMLKPGPPFFSRVSNADLIDFISDSSIMNCDNLREAAAQVQAKKLSNRAMTAFVPSGTVARRVAHEERWTGVGTVWSSLEALPAGATWSQIPGEVSAAGVNPMQDDGLWNSLTLSCDLDCTSVTVARSVVIPTQVLESNNFFNGNAQSLFDDIGAGIKYKFDHLQSALNKNKPVPAKAQVNYLSLSAYTDPASNAFSTSSLNIKWPSWMPWGKKTPAAATPATPTPSEGGQKRVWIPSPTKVSIHASWWGYNIYLPQTVLDSLEGDVDEAEKIANLINKCLNYILNNIPAGLPSTLGAVITILKAIAPTTGYISTFIGWSWDTIKSFNKGQGVILSATWILPVALIPRTWDAPALPAGTVTTPSTPATPTTPLPTDPAATAPATTTPATPAAPAATTPATPAAPAADPSAPSTADPSSPVTVQDTTTTDSEVLPPRPAVPVAAPGATLPPANPSTVNLDLNAPPTNDVANAVYPGNPLGRGVDQTTSAPMGDTPAPANQVPIDAES